MTRTHDVKRDVASGAQPLEGSDDLDPTSRLILQEARERGIEVEILAPRAEFFRLHHDGRSILCRESLSELTNAVVMSRCDDKRTTARVLTRAGLRVPTQREVGSDEENLAFLKAHGSIVVKPARGEQGRGVCVGVRTEEALQHAIVHAAKVSTPVVLEELAHGDDVRLIVIDYQLVAAAVRCPPRVTGDGAQTVRALIAAQSLRRQAETHGEARIPLDDETERCVRDAGHTLDDVLPAGEVLVVRKAANVHTGGTIHDVTPQLNPLLAEVACRAARALEMPVVGLDLMVPDVCGTEYWILEANERPGLANHEPQPTAARFIDFLFPETARR